MARMIQIALGMLSLFFRLLKADVYRAREARRLLG